MEIHSKHKRHQRAITSFYSRPGSISATTLVAMALVGFFFSVAAEGRSSQTFQLPSPVKRSVDSSSVNDLPDEFGAAPDIDISTNGLVSSTSVVVAPEPGEPAVQARRPVYSYNCGVYNQPVKACNYWTGKARAGESVSSLHQASCERTGDYARNAGYGLPGNTIIQQPARRSSQPTVNNVVRTSSNDKVIKRCTYVDERMDWIKSRLRAGYRVAQGERWKQELRDLKKEKYDKCRNLPD